MQSPPHIHVSEDVYLELPPEHILSALGTNYNALIRTWTLRQYQLHLEHHQKMAHYYQQCIRRFEDLEVRYEREPEQPIAPVTAGPIKLSDLAKQRPAYVPQAKPAASPAATPSSGPASGIKGFDASSTKSGTTLSSSLAAKEVKLDKKPKPVNVEVELDAEEREALQEPEMEHFSRPQPKRRNNNKRTDIAKLTDDKEEDEVSTWQENPNAFAAGGAGSKDSKLKSAFSGLKSSLFSKSKEEAGRESGRESFTSPAPVSTTSPTPQQPMTYQQWSTPASSSPSSPTQFNTMGGPPPLKPSGPPPLTTGPPPLNPNVPSNSFMGSGSEPSSGPPRLVIPPPPATPTHAPK